MPRLLELFSGTGSVGRAFEKLGWEVVSIDLEPNFKPTIVADLREWDPTIYPRRYFDCVHASPPCTEYSCARTTAKRPRDLEGSDALVQRTMEMMQYLQPLCWIMENPWTGLLRKRPFMEPLEPRMRVVSYCKYNYPYRKHTSIWSNLNDFWRPTRCEGTRKMQSLLSEPVDPTVALRLLEDVGKLLWRVFSRVIATVLGITATTLLQAWLFVRLLPAFI